MGRKPISDARKSNVLRTMLTVDERSELDTAAAADGKPTSTWARDKLLQIARRKSGRKST